MGSGIVGNAYAELMTSHALGGLAGSRRTLPRAYEAAGAADGRHWSPYCKYDVTLIIRLRQLMLNYLKNNPANFIPIRFEMMEP